MRKRAPEATHVAGVLLAAGEGRRFGDVAGGKLLAPLAGRPLVRHAAEGLLRAGLGDVVVVTGAAHERIAEALAGLRVRLVPNPRAAEGMGTSVAAGVAALGHDVAAAVIALGDQPRVPDAVLAALLHEWRATGNPIVAPRYAGVRGNPVLFDAVLFRHLATLTGDEGARGLIARHAAQVRYVDVAEAMPADVDTVEDLGGMGE